MSLDMSYLLMPVLLGLGGVMAALIGILYRNMLGRCDRLDQRIDDLTTYTRHEFRDINNSHAELVRDVLKEQRTSLSDTLDALRKKP